jgi:hypothetical protein
LVGASKLPQLDDNLGAINLHIAAEDIAELDNLTEPQRLYPNWFHKFVLDSTSVDALHAGLSPGTEKKS